MRRLVWLLVAAVAIAAVAGGVSDVEAPGTPEPTATPSTGSSGPSSFFFPPPRDTTPPYVVSVERTGNATTSNHTLTWDVTFSERVTIRADAIRTNHTSVANATIPDLGAVHDTIAVDVPGPVTGGHVWVDLQHLITSSLLVELLAPDCTRFVIHNQTTTFLYKLQEPRDLGDLAGVGAAGQWTLRVSDHAEYWNGTLNAWGLGLDSDATVGGSGAARTITQYVSGPGNYTLSLNGYDILDLAGNQLDDREPDINEPYHVVGAAGQVCQTE